MDSKTYILGKDLAHQYGITMGDVETIMREMERGYKDKATGMLFVKKAELDEALFIETATAYRLRQKAYEYICEQPGVSRNELCEVVYGYGAGSASRSAIDMTIRILTDKHTDLYEEDDHRLYVMGDEPMDRSVQ